MAKPKRKRKNWIKQAIKHPGALRRSMGVKKGGKIPAGRLRSAAKKPGTLGRRARFAQMLRSFTSKKRKR
jgi:hypothetical protein